MALLRACAEADDRSFAPDGEDEPGGAEIPADCAVSLAESKSIIMDNSRWQLTQMTELMTHDTLHR
jgi:hypothetical protein